MSRKFALVRLYLYIFGSISIIFLSFLPIIFGDWLLWEPRNIPVEIMLSSIYFALGIVMIRVAPRPNNHKSLIDFIVLANVLHAAVMVIFTRHLGHIFDAVVIGAMGIIPMFIYPWGWKSFLRY